jgi:hypothetical protein
MSSNRQPKLLILLLLPLAIVAVLLSRGAVRYFIAGPEEVGTKNELPAAAPPADAPAILASGESLARIYCAACHLFPEPLVLDQRAWKSTLSLMRPYVGLEDPRSLLEVDPEGFDAVLAAGVFAPHPMMTEEQWQKIVAYYLENSLPPATHQPASHPVQTLFTPEVVPTIFDAACLQLGIGDDGLWVSHEGSDTLHLRSPDGKWTLLEPGGTVSQWRDFEGGKIGALIGSFPPSLLPTGSVTHWKNGEFRTIFEPVNRVTDVLPVDLTGNGRQDLVVCEYGTMIGSAFWLENTPEGTKRHTLLEQAGSLNVRTADFNQDGIPDLVILAAEAREGVHLFLSTGPGRFERRTILERHPAWGHTHLEVVDFNGDGHPDLLVTNGDNGEYSYNPHKSYHGIRLHLNDGHNRFDEVFFHHQPGAYKALARDFTGNGKLDIASISYFPDFGHDPRAGFVLLLQEEPMKFTAHGLAVPEGRWLTMDAGDWDGDGDSDLILAAHNYGPQLDTVPPQIRDLWEQRPVPLLLLRNNTR